MTQEALLHLAQEKGTGYYIFDRTKLRENVQTIRSAFGPQFDLAYSIKANYYEGLLRDSLEAGIRFDCASLMELQKLLTFGVPTDRIWVNTPYLTPALVTTAFENGVMLVADSIEQLRVISEGASQAGRPQRIGLRLNFPALEASRFGIALDKATVSAIHQLLENPLLQLSMLHTHFSGPVRSAEAFGERAQQLIDAYQYSFTGYPLEFLNVGGGMAGVMPAALAAQFNYDIPDWEAYAGAVKKAGIDTLPPSLKMVLEPGMALVSDTFGFLAEVMSIKTIGDRSIALLNTSHLFLKPTRHKKQLSFQVIERSDSEAGTYELAGITCMENDLLGVYQGALAKGDLVVFENVGAYTQSYRPDFIFEAPQVVEV
ncbi:MAG: hypothetical protein Roseis2KO_43950 [Roseivirga sp.]